MPFSALVTWLSAYIFAAICFLSPIEKAVEHTKLPQAKETVEERTLRMHAIADDLATVVLDPEEKSIFGSGPAGRGKTAMLLLAIDWMESGFRKDVDLGIGKEAKGGGMDGCLAQIRLGKGATTAEGFTAEDLVNDRKKCFRAQLHLVQRSWHSCKDAATDTGNLAAYAAGGCMSMAGRIKSAERMAVFHRILGTMPVPKAPEKAPLNELSAAPAPPPATVPATYAAEGDK